MMLKWIAERQSMGMDERRELPGESKANCQKSGPHQDPYHDIDEECRKSDFVARANEPSRGWTAFMVELTYTGPRGAPLKLTANVRTVPEKTNHKFVPQTPVSGARQEV